MTKKADAQRSSSAARNPALRVFVTVGTTRFDSLIRAVLSHQFLDAVAQLAPASSCVQVVVQYGNSSIADILTTSAMASSDAGSEIVPEPGMRVINGRRVYQNSANIPALDPGQTGTISGLRLRSTISTSKAAEGTDPKLAGKSVFDSMLQEAKAMSGLSASMPSSSLQGATLDAETEQGVELKLFQFAPDLRSYIRSADVVISHAGSGTILDTLRMKPNTPALVVVPNTSLMDNHQVELAEALGNENYLTVGSEDSLAEDVARACRTKREAFPDFDPSRFTSIVDEAMQF